MNWGNPDFPFRLDSVIEVGIGIFLVVASFTLAIVSKEWTLVLGGIGFAAFLPSRYYNPSPLFRPLTRATLQSKVARDLAEPRWIWVCDLVGIFLLLATVVIRKYG